LGAGTLLQLDEAGAGADAGAGVLTVGLASKTTRR
jgi:hypothetical protein